MALLNRETDITYKEKRYAACITCKSGVTPECGVLITHGAGGDMNTKQLVLFADQLANGGFLVLRFTCKGLNLVHRSNVFLQALKYLRSTEKGLKRCLLAGRSMGSRAAVEVANRIETDEDLSEFVVGIVCISYPLYPPTDKRKLRDAPLKDLKKPVLFISGTQDEMCEKDLLIKTLSSVVNAEFHWVEGAEHSLEAKGVKIEDTVKISCAKINSWFKTIDTNNHINSLADTSGVKRKSKAAQEPKSKKSQVDFEVTQSH